MNPSRTLTITSLILITLVMAHLAQDIAYGYEPGNISNLIAVPIAVVWQFAEHLVTDGRDTVNLFRRGD